MSAILRMARGASTSGAVLTHARCVSGSAVHWAKGAGKGAKKTDAVAADGGASTGSMSTTHCTGLNILKDGKDPEFMPDDQYPDWLWTILDPEKGNIAMKTLGELEKELEAAKKADVDLKYDVMAIKDVKRLLRLRRRAKIKANNALRASDRRDDVTRVGHSLQLSPRILSEQHLGHLRHLRSRVYAARSCI